jgi:hypothetical protein
MACVLRIQSTTGTQDLDFLNAAPIQEDIIEALDAMDVVVETETPLTIEKYSNAWFVGDDKPSGRNWLVLGRSIKYFNGFISYTIHLIEPTKILENFCFNGMAVTGKSSLIQCLEIAIAKMNFQLKKHELRIATELRNFIGNAAAEDFIWSGQKTAREILDEIIECIDARTQIIRRWVLDPSTNKKIIYINAEDPNSVGTNLGADFSSITAEESTEDNDYEYEVGRIETEAVNAVSSTFRIITQAQNLQSPEIIDDKKDRIFMTQYPIYKLRDLYVTWPNLTDITSIYGFNLIGYQESTTPDESGLKTRMGIVPNSGATAPSAWPYVCINNTAEAAALLKKCMLSLKRFIVTREEWNGMTTSDKKDKLYYDLNGPNIYGFNEVHANWWWDTNSVIENISSTAALPNEYKTWYRDNAYYWSWDSNANDYVLTGSQVTTRDTDGLFYIYDTINEETGNLVRWFWSSIPFYFINGADKQYFKCDFEARDSVNYRAQKGTSNAYFEELSILDSKANPDLDRAIRNSMATIKRVGNNTRIINKVFESFSDVYNLHDYVGSGDSKYIITKRTLSFDTGLIIATFEFTKGYNAVQIKTALNREIRTWNIPATGYVDRYIYLDAAELGVTAYNKTFLVWGENANIGLINGLTYYVGSRKYTQYKLQDNIIIGTHTITNNNTKMNEGVRYANENGEAEYVLVIFSNRNDWTLNMGNMVSGALIGGSLQSLHLYKDAFERLIFTIIW